MKELTEQNFDDFIEQDKLTMVDFWGVWCGPCRMVAPILEEISQEINTTIFEIGKVNVDEQKPLVIKYGIRNIPTMIFFKNGEAVDKIVGVVPKQHFLSKIDELK